MASVLPARPHVELVDRYCIVAFNIIYVYANLEMIPCKAKKIKIQVILTFSPVKISMPDHL